MENRILELLEKLVVDVQELKQGQVNLEQGQNRTISRLELLEQGQSKLEQGQSKLEQGQAMLEQGQSKLEQGQAMLEQGQSKLEQGQARLEDQVSENTLILKALEHAAQVNKAEHDTMMNDIAQIKGDIIGIKRDLSLVEAVTAQNWSDLSRLKAAK